jgi:hypothetical protein
MNENFNSNDIIDRIIAYTNDEKCGEIVEKAMKKYNEIDSSFNSNLFNEVYQSLLHVAEETKDFNSVVVAAKCYLSDYVLSIPQKYRGNALSEVFANTAWIIEEHCKMELTKKYVEWVSNGWMSRLLNFISEFPGNGNLRLERDIYSLLSIDVNSLEKFDEFAAKINRKRLPLEKKIEVLSVLRDVINTKRDEFAGSLVNNQTNVLKEVVESELGTKLSNTTYSLKCGVRFLQNLKKDPNLQFLLKKDLEHGSVRKWLADDEVSKNVMNEMKHKGFNPNLYVASGELISQRTTNGMFSQNPVEILKRIVIEIVGSRRENTLPTVSIYGHSPGQIFKVIKNDYQSAIQNQDKDTIKKVLKNLKDIIEKTYDKRRMPKYVLHALNNIYGLEFVLENGGALTFRGAKVRAKVWKRKIPEDLYDSEELWCCLFLPDGDKNEIPLFVMDPKVTLLQFTIQGLNNPISIAFFYAGMVDGQPALFVDTWEGGGLVYSALGQEKMKEFALDSMQKFAKKAGAKKLLIFSDPSYSRAREFVNYLRDKEFEIKKVNFEAVDPEDSILKKYSKSNKHHYTDAFGTNPIKGKLNAFVFEI